MFTLLDLSEKTDNKYVKSQNVSLWSFIRVGIKCGTGMRNRKTEQECGTEIEDKTRTRG